MRVRNALVTLAALTTLALPNAFTSQKGKIFPLISSAYAEEKTNMGDRMGPPKQKQIDEGNLAQDANAISEIRVKLGAGNKLTADQATTLEQIWTTWKNQRSNMNSEQQRQIFAPLLELVKHAEKNQLLEQDAAKKLKAAGLLTRTSIMDTVEGARTEEPKFKFFPEVVVIKKDIHWGEPPDVTLAPALSSRIEVAERPEFSQRVEEAIFAQIKHGKGSKEAKAAGESLIKQLERLPGTTWRAKLGANADEVLEKLRDGDIIDAVKTSGNLVEGLKKTVEKITFESPVAVIRLAGETQRLKIYRKFLLSGVAALDLLVSERYRANYDEETGEVSLKLTEEKTAASVIKLGPKGTIEFRKGTELWITPSLVLPIGIPGAAPARFGLGVGFKDVSGRFNIAGKVPIYSTVALDYETPDEFGQSGSLKARAGLGTSFIPGGGVTLMPMIDLDLLLLGQKDIQMPTWVLSPGLKVGLGEHELGVRVIFGSTEWEEPDTYGGGVLYSYDKLTLNFDLTHQTVPSIPGVDPISGLVFSGGLRVDLPE